VEWRWCFDCLLPALAYACLSPAYLGIAVHFLPRPCCGREAGGGELAPTSAAGGGLRAHLGLVPTTWLPTSLRQLLSILLSIGGRAFLCYPVPPATRALACVPSRHAAAAENNTGAASAAAAGASWLATSPGAFVFNNARMALAGLVGGRLRFISCRNSIGLRRVCGVGRLHAPASLSSACLTSPPISCIPSTSILFSEVYGNVPASQFSVLVDSAYRSLFLLPGLCVLRCYLERRRCFFTRTPLCDTPAYRTSAPALPLPVCHLIHLSTTAGFWAVHAFCTMLLLRDGRASLADGCRAGFFAGGRTVGLRRAVSCAALATALRYARRAFCLSLSPPPADTVVHPSLCAFRLLNAFERRSWNAVSIAICVRRG